MTWLRRLRTWLNEKPGLALNRRELTERLTMAWARIEELEKKQARQHRVNATVETALSAELANLQKNFQKQLDDLRAVLAADMAPVPAPKRAANWREVQNFLREEENVSA